MSGLTYKAMQRAAADQKPISDRIEMLVNRTPEELYDFEADPGALHNLCTDPKFQDRVKQKRTAMLKWMEETQDPLLPKFRDVVGAEVKDKN